jgi:hypothetical protein
MAVATDPQSLLTAAQCYDCFGSSTYMLDLMKVALLAQISLAKNPANNVTPQGLLAAANCYQCFGASEYMLKLMELALLAQIAGP